MKKEDIRKEFFKLSVKHHSYNQCKKIIQAQLGYKVTLTTEEKIVKIRNKTGWGQERIADYVDVSHWSVNKILNKHNLTSPSQRKKKRNKYVRFEREHPNTMWQIDHGDQKV